MLKKLSYALCKLTGLTGVVTRFTSVSYFLPKLFRLRYANFGGIPSDELWAQIKHCRSFEESDWCGYWNRFAAENEAEGRRLLDAGDTGNAIVPIQKAIAYYSISAFPGHTPQRMAAYRSGERVFDLAVGALSTSLSHLHIEKVYLSIEGETFYGYLVLPDTSGKYPVALVTNGLEGTIPELILPLKDVVDLKVAAFFMEMPGTYQYKKPLSTESEKIYSGVIDYLADHPNIDAGRIGMAGVSFGAHWSARMAARDSRIQCAVANGGNYTFPLSLHSEIIIGAIRKVTGANSIADVVKTLRSLSFKQNDGEIYHQITVPLLVINGSKDTLFPTGESVVLAESVQNGTLKLYEGSDHCAMENYSEMIALMFDWMTDRLSGVEILARD